MNLRKKHLHQAIALLCAGLAGTTAQADGAQKLGEVVVTSTTIDDRFESKRDEPSNISVISGKKIDAAHVENIMQVLQAIPGVTADLSSGEEIKIKLRGIENQRYMGEKPGVAIVIDGVPVFERTGKVNIGLDNIESIKVIKGGASYMFGDDGLAGAVIITTKRGAQYAGVTLGAEAGSYGFNKEVARAGLAGEMGSGHVQISKRQSDDYYYQSGYRNETVNGNFNLYLSDTSDLTFGFEKNQREKDKHGSVKGSIQAELDPTGTIGRDYARKFDVDLQKLNLTYSNSYAPNSNLLLLGYEYKDHTIFWSAPQRMNLDGSTNNDVNAYTVNNDYHQDQRGVKGEWRSGADKLGWLAGFDVRRNNYQNFNTAKVDYCSTYDYRKKTCTSVTRTGAVLSNDATDENVNAAYGELKFMPNQQWTLTFNGRYDNIGLDYSTGSIYNADINAMVKGFNAGKSFNVSSWRGGANYAASDSVSFYGNLSTGFRAPTADQLYRGSLSPTGKTENNTDLKPEQAINLEFGVRNKTELLGVGLDIDAAIFQIDRKDFIMSTLGQYGAGGKTIDKYDNIGGARNRGFELSLKSDRKREFTLDMAYTYISAFFTQYDAFYLPLGSPYVTNPVSALYNNTGRHIPRVSAHQLNSTVAWQPSSAFRVGLEMDAKSWAWADEINQEKQPGRTLFNLLANYDIKGDALVKGAKWSFFARIDNLFDRKYWVTARGTGDQGNYVTGVYDGVYNAQDPSIIVGRPRTWTAGVSATF
ncbi:MAG: TonB-dependent receptor [Sulfuricella sp.]|nr:TonB-dependent receptor [Sulfuricella sp.]